MKVSAVVAGLLSLLAAREARGDAASEDMTIIAAAPVGMNASHLGRPYSATFEPLIGKEGKSLFPESRKPREDIVNEFKYDVVEIENSHQFRANASAWSYSVDVAAAASQRYTAYRAYQLTKVLELDDTSEPRPVSGKASYYVRRIYFGRMLEIVVSGDASAFTANAKAEFVVLGGSIAAFAKKYKLELKTVGRGLKAAHPTEALFATTQDSIKEAYVADPDFNGGNAAPILVEYRRIPESPLPDFATYEWRPEDAAVSSARLRFRSIEVDASDSDWQTCGLTLNRGDRAMIFVSGSVGIAMGKVREADAKEKTLDEKWGPAPGSLELKLGALTEATGLKTVVEGTEDAKELKFRVRDTKYIDNSGRYTVKVFLVPAVAMPEEPEL